MSDTYTYIESETLIAWGNRMAELNKDALDIVSSIEKEVQSLTENDWKGNASEGFARTMKNLTTDARIYHNKMKDIEKMLNEVVITAENQ